MTYKKNNNNNNPMDKLIKDERKMAIKKISIKSKLVDTWFDNKLFTVNFFSLKKPEDLVLTETSFNLLGMGEISVEELSEATTEYYQTREIIMKGYESNYPFIDFGYSGKTQSSTEYASTLASCWTELKTIKMELNTIREGEIVIPTCLLERLILATTSSEEYKLKSITGKGMKALSTKQDLVSSGRRSSTDKIIFRLIEVKSGKEFYPNSVDLGTDYYRDLNFANLNTYNNHRAQVEKKESGIAVTDVVYYMVNSDYSHGVYYSASYKLSTINREKKTEEGVLSKLKETRACYQEATKQCKERRGVKGEEGVYNHHLKSREDLAIKGKALKESLTGVINKTKYNKDCIDLYRIKPIHTRADSTTSFRYEAGNGKQVSYEFLEEINNGSKKR